MHVIVAEIDFVQGLDIAMGLLLIQINAPINKLLRL